MNGEGARIVTRLDVEHLTPRACMRLLGTVRVGRLALTQHALPVVLPVNFAIDDHGVVIRTGAGSLLAASKTDVVVAFGADVVDVEAGTGWSVLVTGTMREIPAEHNLADLLEVVPWGGGEGVHVVRITAGLVSGRTWRQAATSPYVSAVEVLGAVGSGAADHVAV